MKKKDIREILKTAISLFLICAVSAGILAAVNSITSPTIQANSLKNEDEARKELLPAADTFTQNTSSDGTVYYTGSAGDTDAGYVFTTSASGYGGNITVMTGIGTDGKITGISILSIDETPGLGMKAKKPDFLGQFTGKSGELSVVKGGNAGDSEINALTSATITSKAVTKAVNTALSLFGEVTAKTEG